MYSSKYFDHLVVFTAGIGMFYPPWIVALSMSHCPLYQNTLMLILLLLLGVLHYILYY